MYIAFAFLHPNFNNINETYFTSMKSSILNCVNDKNFVHIYFASNNNVHKYDKFFKHSRISLYHLSNYKDDITTMNECYFHTINQSGFDYHWIIKLRPDILVFDKNIFVNIRSKYDTKHIHARSRFYSGPLTLSKNQKSNWNDNSHVENSNQNLLVMDNQLYMIPYSLQFFAFKSSSLGLLPNNGIYNEHDLQNKDISSVYIDQLKPFPELNQTLLWNRFNIPLKITELNVVLMSDLNQYNFL
jgi:hypothetical protein